MLSTNDMSIDERLSFVKSLFDESVQREEQRALEKKHNKRKRQESGNSISSSKSSASYKLKTLSPPNKKRRENEEKVKTENCDNSQPKTIEANLRNSEGNIGYWAVIPGMIGEYK